MACTQLAREKSIKCRKLTRRSQATKNEVKQSNIDHFFCAEEGQE